MNLKVTDKAKEFINKNKENDDLYFCLLIKGGGCSGLSYDYSYKTENELRALNLIDISIDEFNVYSNKSSLVYLTDCEIRYEDGLNSKGLEIYNPHAVRTCACGESFGY